MGRGIAQTDAKLPWVRVGRRWFSTLWLVPLGIVGLVLSIAVVREMAHYEWFHEFIAKYPGTSAQYVQPVQSGFPWWLRWQHFLNLLFMMFIIRAGLQILADHPRLYLNAGSKPDTEWLRLRGPVPPIAATAPTPTTCGPPRKIPSRCRSSWESRGFGTPSDWPDGGTSASTCSGW